MDNNKSDAKPMVLLEGQTSGSGVEPADLQGLLKELEKEREFLEQAGSCPRALAYVLRGESPFFFFSLLLGSLSHHVTHRLQIQVCVIKGLS